MSTHGGLRDGVAVSAWIDDIIVPPRRRAIDWAFVDELAASFEKVPQQHRITIRRKDDKYILVAGRHRLEAHKKLKLDFIPAMLVAMTDEQARMWEISENLHRAELTKLERAEHIEEWRKLCVARGSREDRFDSLGRHNPRHDGERVTAKELGIDRRTVRRAKVIAKISPDAKAAAREAGIDDNQAKLIEVAQEPEPRQVAKVIELSGRTAERKWIEQFKRLWAKGSDEDHAQARAHIAQPCWNAMRAS